MSNAAVRWVEVEEANNRVRMPDSLADRQSTRFVWQAREDIPHAEVLGGVIERCRVMPIVRRLQWERIEDVPLEFREPGMLRKDHEGKIAYAAYPILPGYIFEAIFDQYRNWGVVELTALKGMAASEFAALRIDDLFFPQSKNIDQAIDELPQSYKEMRRQIAACLQALQMDQDGLPGQLASYSPYQRQALIQTGQQMLRGINIAERYDNALVDESEGELELGKNNSRFKQKYDGADLAALNRLGRPRKDAFIKELADQQLDLHATVRDAIAGKSSQAVDVAEIAQAVGASVAAEFAKLFASQRGIQLPDASPAAPADEAESTKPQTPPQGKQPKFQNNK